MYFILLGKKHKHCTKELKEGLVEEGHLNWARNYGV